MANFQAEVTDLLSVYEDAEPNQIHDSIAKESTNWVAWMVKHN